MAARVKDYAGKVTGAGYKACMDDPKLPMELLDPLFLEGVARVLEYGAQKYAKNNWMSGMAWTVVFGSILRHLWAWARGETLDLESGLPHLHHAACGLMFLCRYTGDGRYRKLDDRVFTAATTSSTRPNS